MDWLQLHFQVVSDQAEQLEHLLLASGAVSISLQSANDEDFFDSAVPQTPDWQAIIMTALYKGDADPQPVLGLIAQTLGKALANTVQTSRLRDEDWERAWLGSFQATEPGPGLWVCPSWQTPPVADAINLILDPGLAFGTGTHETTGLCLNWLARHPPINDAVLDYGCGSGILSIASVLLGAKQAYAVDIDPHALTATRANANQNEVSDQVFISSPQEMLIAEGEAELVVANILASVIIDLSTTLTNYVSPRGTLLLTGILATQSDSVIEAFSNNFVFNVQQRGDWALLIGTRLGAVKG